MTPNKFVMARWLGRRDDPTYVLQCIVPPIYVHYDRMHGVCVCVLLGYAGRENYYLDKRGATFFKAKWKYGPLVEL